MIERWHAAARSSGTIEVTDPEMTRFLMSADEAVAALLDAAARDDENAIVAPSLPAYRLGDLADAFASAHEARVVTVGPRPGERTHESLVSAEEARFARREADGFVITPGRPQAGVEPYRSCDAPRLGAAELARYVLADARA